MLGMSKLCLGVTGMMLLKRKVGKVGRGHATGLTGRAYA